MKTSKHLLNTTLILSLAGFAWLPASGFAQDKGATKLIQLNRIQTVGDAQTVKRGDTAAMSCPTCRDGWRTVVDKSAKQGARAGSKAVLRHECPDCEHRIVTEGQGKHAADKVIHTCKNIGSEDASCCVLKKSAADSASGMGK